MKNSIMMGSMVMLPEGTSEIKISSDNYRGEEYELIYRSSGRRERYRNDSERKIMLDPNGGQVSISNNTSSFLYWEKIK